MTTSGPQRPSFDSHDQPTRIHAWRDNTARLASAKAAAFWTSLRADLVDLVDEATELGLDPAAIVPADHAELYAVTTSDEIDTMLGDIRDLRAQLRTARRMAARADRPARSGALEEDRLYELDGEIYRTVRSGQGNLYAKIWMGDGWDYAAGAIRHLRPEHRMTVERAKELSVRFGRCIRCGALLTAEESVERGIGPICITKI